MVQLNLDKLTRGEKIFVAGELIRRLTQILSLESVKIMNHDQALPPDIE